MDSEGNPEFESRLHFLLCVTSDKLVNVAVPPFPLKLKYKLFLVHPSKDFYKGLN